MLKAKQTFAGFSSYFPEINIFYAQQKETIIFNSSFCTQVWHTFTLSQRNAKDKTNFCRFFLLFSWHQYFWCSAKRNTNIQQLILHSNVLFQPNGSSCSNQCNAMADSAKVTFWAVLDVSDNVQSHLKERRWKVCLTIWFPDRLTGGHCFQLIFMHGHFVL